MNLNIDFCKYSGSGNDFIVIDNRDQIVPDDGLSELIQKVCRRRMSVGADGFILIENDDTLDFKWRFYNADGGRAEMCGNGARCAARFAYLNNIAGSRMAFQTDTGIVAAMIRDDRVKIRMPDPVELKLDEDPSNGW